MSTQEAFIEKLQAYGSLIDVLPSIMISQAALESSWGNSGLTVQANNLFGIKGAYQGQSHSMQTSEYSASRGWYKVVTPFRKYPSWRESVLDYNQLLLNGVSWNRNLYRPVIEAKNYREAAAALQTAGYATDPSYAAKLIKIIETYQLDRFDVTEPVAEPGEVISWMETQGRKALYELVEKGIIESPEYWEPRLLEAMPVWAVLSLLSRMKE